MKALPKRKSKYGIIKRDHKEMEELLQFRVEMKRFKRTNRIAALGKKKEDIDNQISTLNEKVNLQEIRDKIYSEVFDPIKKE